MAAEPKIVEEATKSKVHDKTKEEDAKEHESTVRFANLKNTP